MAGVSLGQGTRPYTSYSIPTIRWLPQPIVMPPANTTAYPAKSSKSGVWRSTGTPSSSTLTRLGTTVPDSLGYVTSLNTASMTTPNGKPSIEGPTSQVFRSESKFLRNARRWYGHPARHTLLRRRQPDQTQETRPSTTFCPESCSPPVLASARPRRLAQRSAASRSRSPVSQRTIPGSQHL